MSYAQIDSPKRIHKAKSGPVPQPLAEDGLPRQPALPQLLRQLGYSAVWTIFGSVSSRGLMLIAMIVVGRLLGQQGFGAFAVVQSTVAMFSDFIGFGLGLTATKFVAQFREHDPALAGRVFNLACKSAGAASACMAVTLALFAPWIAHNVLGAAELTVALRIGAVALSLSGLTSVYQGGLAGLQAFQDIAKANVTAGAIGFVLIVAGASLYGLSGAVSGFALNSLTTCILMRSALRRRFTEAGLAISGAGCLAEWPILATFTMPAILAGAAVGAANGICPILLVQRLHRFDDVAVFNVANQWFLAVTYLPVQMGNVLTPFMANRLGANDQSGSLDIFRLSMVVNMACTIPMLLAIGSISPYVMGLHGEDYRSEWPTLLLLLGSACMLALLKPAEHVIHSHGKAWPSLFMHGGFAALYIGLTALLADLGAVGMAAGRSMAFAIHALWMIAFACYLQRHAWRPASTEMAS